MPRLQPEDFFQFRFDLLLPFPTDLSEVFGKRAFVQNKQMIARANCGGAETIRPIQPHVCFFGVTSQRVTG